MIETSQSSKYCLKKVLSIENFVSLVKVNVISTPCLSNPLGTARPTRENRKCSKIFRANTQEWVFQRVGDETDNLAR